MADSTIEASTTVRIQMGISESQLDNKFIFIRYRQERADHLATLKSLRFLYHKTCNVYTHMVGAVALRVLSTTIMRLLAVSGTSLHSMRSWLSELRQSMHDMHMDWYPCCCCC